MSEKVPKLRRVGAAHGSYSAAPSAPEEPVDVCTTSIAADATSRQVEEPDSTFAVSFDHGEGSPDSSPEKQKQPALRLLSLAPDVVGHVEIPRSGERTEFVIGRDPSCNLVLKNNTLSGKHCKLVISPTAVLICDMSLNGTLVDGVRLEKQKEVPIHSGAEISFITHSHGQPKLAFVLQAQGLPTPTASQQEAEAPSQAKRAAESDPGAAAADSGEPAAKKPALDAEAAATSAAVPASTDTAAADSEKDKVAEELICAICQEILHDCVSILPCLHNFCGGCLSMWLETGRTCPDCREPIKEARRNHTLRNLVDKFLESHPEKKRNKEELEELDKKNKITSERFRVRRSDYDDEGSDDYGSDDEDYTEEDDDDDPVVATLVGHHRVHFTPLHALGCAACRDGSLCVDGIQCPPTGALHLMCTCCRTNFPSRIAGATSGSTASVGASSGTTAAVPATTPAAGADVAASGTSSTAAADAPASTTGTDSGTASGAATTSPAISVDCKFCRRSFCNQVWRAGCRLCRYSAVGGCLQRLADMRFLDGDCLNVLVRNPYETKVLNDYLHSKGLTWDTMFRSSVDGVVAGTLTLPASATGFSGLQPTDSSCQDCAKKLLAELALAYRQRIDHSDLPASGRNRPDGGRRDDCWHGFQCRTQYSRPHHAANFNHICSARGDS